MRLRLRYVKWRASRAVLQQAESTAEAVRRLTWMDLHLAQRPPRGNKPCESFMPFFGTPEGYMRVLPESLCKGCGWPAIGHPDFVPPQGPPLRIEYEPIEPGEGRVFRFP